MAEITKMDPADSETILKLLSGRFDIRAELIRDWLVRNYDDVILYENFLNRHMEQWLSIARIKCSKLDLVPSLKLRLTQRTSHWKAEALKLARENQEKRRTDITSHNIDEVLQKGQEALNKAVKEDMNL